MSEMTKQKEITESKCSDLEATNVGLVREAGHVKALNEALKKHLQDAQVDFISVRDNAFERAQAQALFIMPDLDVIRMDFFKIVVDEQLVDMDDASLET